MLRPSREAVGVAAALLVDVMVDFGGVTEVGFVVKTEVEAGEVNGEAVIIAASPVGFQGKVAQVCSLRIKATGTGCVGDDTCNGIEKVQDVGGLSEGSWIVIDQEPSLVLRVTGCWNEAVIFSFFDASSNTSVEVMMVNDLNSRQLKKLSSVRVGMRPRERFGRGGWRKQPLSPGLCQNMPCVVAIALHT